MTTADHPPASSTRRASLDWTDVDRRAVDTVRTLAMDAVQKTGNGHPGTAMSLAPVAYLLYQRLLRHDPSDSHWPGRDRFVLSAGHSSLTQYIQLYLSGYDLELADLEALRTWGSKTPGHPEVNHTDGIEITTGPLGQGLASAVGMAAAARRERGLLDPDASPGESPFDHTIWVIASDGDIEEGLTSEASSWAGHQELGNLVVIYDANRISIEDDTTIALSEDTAKRYEAYGWHVQTVDWTNGEGPAAGPNGTYHEDVEALNAALLVAREERRRPSIVVLRTIIAWPAPDAQNTGKAHGAALGDEEVRATKLALGADPDATFAVDDEVLAHTRAVGDRGRELHAALGGVVHRLAQHPPRAGGVVAAAVRAPAPGRVGRRTADLPVRQGRRDPQGLRGGAQRARPGAARAVGRVRRPRRQQQHGDGRRGVVRPRGVPDRDVEGRPLRPHPALRHPRARDGGDAQRHRPARRHPSLRCDLPGVQRLHAPRRTAGRAVQDAGDVRVDARLDRPRRGRPDAPADRAPGGTACDPRPRRRAAR